MKNENTKDIQNKTTDLNSMITKNGDCPHLRILDADEQILFTPEAWNQINNYLYHGVINIEQFEYIIAKLSEIGTQYIDVENLKRIVDSVIIMQSTKTSSLSNIVFFTPRDIVS